MAQKLFIVLLCLFALSKCQKCPQTPGAAATVNCVLVDGCNFSNNGSLTPVATACDNELSDADCESIFPCPTSSTSGGAVCDRTGSGTDSASFPYVRAPACTNSNLQDIALQCAKTCALCCLSSDYDCTDDSSSPISCSANINKCNNANWTTIMAQYCPYTCGLCSNGTCTDINSGCSTMTSLCKNVDWITYMSTNCARTCGTCNTTSSSSSCSNIASNCAANSNLCTNSVYRTLMLQQCCATCNGTSTSSSSSTCYDSSSSCSSWVKNGFCSSTFYTTAQKKSYCASSCSLC